MKRIAFLIFSVLYLQNTVAQVIGKYVIFTISYNHLNGDNIKDDFEPVVVGWNNSNLTKEYLKDVYFNIQPRSCMDKHWAREASQKNYSNFIKRNKIIAFDKIHCDKLYEIKTKNNHTVEQISKLRPIIFKYEFSLRDRTSGLNLSLFVGTNEKGSLYIDSVWPERYVFLPFKEVMKLRHADYSTLYGIWIEPADFAKAFEKYGLLELKSEDVPYLTMYPLEINPSFDCVNAVSRIEKAICHNKFLASLDRLMAFQYAEKLKTGEKENVRNKQRAWLWKRDKLESLEISHDSLIELLQDSYVRQLAEVYGYDFSSQEKIDYYEFRQKAVPSFDCQTAQTEVEKLICRNDTIAYLDRELHEVFLEAKKLKGEEAVKIQREWLQMRDAEVSQAPDKVKRLTNLYNEWLYELMYYVFTSQPAVYNKILKTP